MTGGGKTVIYVLAHLLTKKTIVVFSPLITLIQDQARAIALFDVTIRTVSIIAGQTSEEERKALKEGRIDIGSCVSLFVYSFWWVMLCTWRVQP